MIDAVMLPLFLSLEHCLALITADGMLLALVLVALDFTTQVICATLFALHLRLGTLSNIVLLDTRAHYLLLAIFAVYDRVRAGLRVVRLVLALHNYVAVLTADMCLRAEGIMRRSHFRIGTLELDITAL